MEGKSEKKSVTREREKARKEIGGEKRKIEREKIKN